MEAETKLGFDNDTVNAVYDKTEGFCYYCGKKLSFKNYGKQGNHGSWEIDHSKPKSRGGTDYLRNLVPSCTSCNRDKSVSHGTNYKKNFEPKTLGGWLTKELGLPDGFLGSSRRRVRVG